MRSGYSLFCKSVRNYIQFITNINILNNNYHIGSTGDLRRDGTAINFGPFH